MCGEDLEFHPVERMYKCGDCKEFAVMEKRFNEIINSMYKLPKKLKVRHEDDNLEELNNLDREEVMEDFSDSKFLE